MPEDENNQPVVTTTDDDTAFINSLLNPEDEVQPPLDVELTEEQKAEAELKKKNAEEAEKRRIREAKEKAELEAKEKAELEAKQKLEAEEKAKAEAEAKAKVDDEAKKKADEEAHAKSESEQKKATQVQVLAKQIADFKIKYSDVDIQKLQQDKNFTEYLDGKLLGKKSFTELFEGYSEFVKRIGGKDLTTELSKNSAKPSSQSANKGLTPPSDIYSEEELNSLSKRLPFMHLKEYDKVSAKIARSVAYYNKK